MMYLFKIFTLLKQSLLAIFHFGLKHPKTIKVLQQTAKIVKLPYYLKHIYLKNPCFDLFSRTFDMESPSIG